MFESLKIWGMVWESRWWFQIFFMFIPKIGEMIQFDSRIFFSDGWLNHQLTSDDYTTENQHSTWNFGWFFPRLLRWVPLTIKGFHDAPQDLPGITLDILTFLAPQDRGQDPPWAENATSGAAMAVFCCCCFLPGEEDIYRYSLDFS